MPLQIVNKTTDKIAAEVVVSREQLVGALRQEKNPLIQLENFYLTRLKQAMEEKKSSLLLPGPTDDFVNYQGELTLWTMDLIRKQISSQPKGEEELLVYLVLEDVHEKSAGSPYPELERLLRKTQKAYNSCCAFSIAPEEEVDFCENKTLGATRAFDENCEYASNDSVFHLKKELTPISPAKPLQEMPLEELLKHRGLTFSQLLMKLLDERGISDVDFYRRANIDRKLFSKIRNKDYQPSKNTVLATVVSLRLSVEEASKLMAAAGYAWNDSNKTDIIVMFYLRNKNYDIDNLNLSLYNHGEKTLGAKMA